MSSVERLVAAESVAIVGLSDAPGKHGGRVLSNLRRLGFEGRIWGVNPRLPEIDGVSMFAGVGELPHAPDVVVCAVPAEAAPSVVSQSRGAGFAIVFAGGFGESGEHGLESDLLAAAAHAGVRLVGPNSGGVIRPDFGLALSFLTCLDRPVSQIRGGRVGLVTQSGGTGSYIHNLAASRGSGLAISVSTGNELDLKAGEALGAVGGLEGVEVVLAILETVRDGDSFIESLTQLRASGVPVVACRIGTGRQGKELMATHTGAMAVPDRVLDGILDSLGVAVGATPGEAYDIAECLAFAERADGDRVGVVTHSGGIAIHLADLAESSGVPLPPPSDRLVSRLESLLDMGTADNPLDMGGIIGGPGRFAEVVREFADSGEYDSVLAVSTAHPPAHSLDRVDSLIGLDSPVPILHLWMAGDQAAEALDVLRSSGAPVSEEPRGAIRAMAHLHRPGGPISDELPIDRPFAEWGIPLIPRIEVASSDEAVEAALAQGLPVVLKLVAIGLDHKTEIGGVIVDIRSEAAVADGYRSLANLASKSGLVDAGVVLEPYRPGLEVIVGGLVDPVFGPLISVGLGGVFTEVLGDIAFSPAPVSPEGAAAMVGRLESRAMFSGFRGVPAADLDRLAQIVSIASRGLVGTGLSEFELNPLIWDGQAWSAVDWLLRPPATDE